MLHCRSPNSDAGQTGGPDARTEVARGSKPHDSKPQHLHLRGSPSAPAAAAVLDQIIVPNNRTQASSSVPASSKALSGAVTAETSKDQALSSKQFQQPTALGTASSAANGATSAAAALRAPHWDHPVRMDTSRPNSNGNAEAARPATSQMAGLAVGKPIPLPPTVCISQLTLGFLPSTSTSASQAPRPWGGLTGAS